MARSLPHTLAPLVEDLELDGVVIATTKELTARAERVGVKVPRVAIERLHKHGWLLKSGVAGVWEFAPGAHAGPHSHGDPYLVLRAQLALTPEMPARVTLGSALWRLGITDRAPDRHEVSLPPKEHVPESLRRAYDISRFASRLPPVNHGGIPLNSAATTLVQLAETTSAVRGWGGVLEILPELVAEADDEQVLEELAARPMSTKVRLSYLLETIAPELVERIGADPAHVVWFGKRGETRRFDARWKVADTILPRHPAGR